MKVTFGDQESTVEAPPELPHDILKKILASAGDPSEPAARLRMLVAFNMTGQLKKEIQNMKQNVATTLLQTLQKKRGSSKQVNVYYKTVDHYDSEGYESRTRTYMPSSYTFRLTPPNLIVVRTTTMEASTPVSKIMHNKGFKQFWNDLRRGDKPLGIWMVRENRGQTMEKQLGLFHVERNTKILSTQLAKVESLHLLETLRKGAESSRKSASDSYEQFLYKALHDKAEDVIARANRCLSNPSRNHANIHDIIEEVNQLTYMAKELQRGATIYDFESVVVQEPDY